MYFERGAYDPTAAAEARTRLQAFQGATSISSNQYFGREENEGEDGMMSGSEGGLLGDGSLAGLETAARDALARVMANPDVQNVGENIRQGALKVCCSIRHHLFTRPDPSSVLRVPCTNVGTLKGRTLLVVLSPSPVVSL